MSSSEKIRIAKDVVNLTVFWAEPRNVRDRLFDLPYEYNGFYSTTITMYEAQMLQNTRTLVLSAKGAYAGITFAIHKSLVVMEDKHLRLRVYASTKDSGQRNSKQEGIWIKCLHDNGFRSGSG